MSGGKGGRLERHAFKVICPESLISSLLGRGGATKDAIQSETGVRIVASNRNEYFPGTRFRVLVLHSDDASGIVAALERVIDRLAECADEEAAAGGRRGGEDGDYHGKEPGEYVIRAALPAQCTSALIGPKGSNIQSIRQECSSKLFLDKESVQGHQVLRLIAVVDNLKQAIARVNDYVQGEAAGTDAFLDWSLVRSFSADARGDSSRTWGREADHRHRSRSRSRRRRSRSRDRGSGGGARGGDRPSKGGGRGRQEPMLMKLATALSEFPAGGVDAEFVITCDLPRAKVSALIGKGGDHVTRVKKGTGAQVRFDEVAAGSDNNDGLMQTMTIRGPITAVYRAHALMMRRYHEDELEKEEGHGGGGGKGRSGGGKGGGGGGGESGLQAHIAELQKQLELARRQEQRDSPKGGKGGGRPRGR